MPGFEMLLKIMQLSELYDLQTYHHSEYEQECKTNLPSYLTQNIKYRRTTLIFKRLTLIGVKLN